jgi:hypothetical protein
VWLRQQSLGKLKELGHERRSQLAQLKALELRVHRGQPLTEAQQAEVRGSRR